MKAKHEPNSERKLMREHNRAVETKVERMCKTNSDVEQVNMTMKAPR